MTRPVRLIAFTGRKGSGKNTAARFAGDKFGGGEFAFADALKNACRMIWGLSHEQVHGNQKEFVDPTWGLTPRFIMQRFGTEVGRSIHRNTWIINTLGMRIPAWWKAGVGVAYITDCRFENECAAVQQAGGVVIRIVRSVGNESWFLRFLRRWPRVRTWWLVWVLGEHPSEAAIDTLPADFEIVNDKELADFRREVEWIVGGVLRVGKNFGR